MVLFLLHVMTTVLTTSVSSLELSNVLGDHMVLQRNIPATVWGFASPGVKVTTVFKDFNSSVSTDSNGTWRQKLPTQSAGGPYTITFISSDGGKVALKDVLFGDVYLCGGQSNMQFSTPSMNNHTAEIQAANNYPSIRLFTVGQGNSSGTPFKKLGSIEQPWTPASNLTVGNQKFTYFSAVCWLFGRNLFDEHKGNVPIGLISSNWGGTKVQRWSSPAPLEACNQSTIQGSLWNAMIVPYTIGPMAMNGQIWYQGEANVGQADYYKCGFPAMITDWRLHFQSKSLWFGFVQIAGCDCYHNNPSVDVGDLRMAQLAALSLPNVGFTTAIDVGNGHNIHPTDKQTVARRLSDSAMSMIFGDKRDWQPPMYASSSTSREGDNVLVTISFTKDNLKLTSEVPPYALTMHANDCIAAVGNVTVCGFPTIYLDDGTVLNATATLVGTNTLLLKAMTKSKSHAVRTTYGRGAWPVSLFWDAENGWPIIPWDANITADDHYQLLTPTTITSYPPLFGNDDAQFADGYISQY